MLVVLVYATYSSGRLLARGDVETALDHGRRILEIEQFLHINPERALNEVVTRVTALGVFFDFAYATLHYVVTPAVLIWVWRRFPGRYRAVRTWLALSTVLGLIGFILLPTAPPRLLPDSYGFVDTMAQYASFGWWGAEASAPRGLGGMTNQYAAMPSLHVGWSLWCGLLLWRYARAPWVRALGVIYPLLTIVVVMATANHYLLDAVGGALVMGLGLLLVRPALRLTSRWRNLAEQRLADRRMALRGTTPGILGPGRSRTDEDRNGQPSPSLRKGSTSRADQAPENGRNGDPASGARSEAKGLARNGTALNGTTANGTSGSGAEDGRRTLIGRQISREEPVHEAERGAGGASRASGS